VLLIIAALQKEAAPLISRFRLKKDMRIFEFPVYLGQDAVLVVSGVGKLRAAIAATFLLSGNYCPAHEALLCNIGFCGSTSEKYAPGTLCAAHKVTDADTKRDYYPDYPISVEMGIPMSALLCVPQIIRSVTDPLLRPFPDAELIDMESSGIMEAGGRFLQTHQILLLKIVSDILAGTHPDMLNPKLLDEYMHSGVLLAEPILRKANENIRNSPGIIDDRDLREWIDAVSARLHLTVQMEHRLYHAARKSLLSGIRPEAILSSFPGTSPAGKQERTAALEQFIVSFGEK
jgi:nucleoside phosphorylase